jgi:glycosyltransferase involved in cell wall biosynthesis
MVVPVPWQEVLAAAARGKRIARHYRNEDGIEFDHPRYYYLPKVRPDWLGEAYLLSAGGTVRQVAREFQPDAILSFWAHPDGWAAARLGRELGLPVVLKVMGSDLLVATGHARRRKRIVEALRNVDRVVAVSHDLARQAVRLGAAPEAVSVVPEGVDRELFSPGDRQAARQRLGLVAGTLRVPSQSLVAGTLRVPSQSSVAGTLRVPSQSLVAGTEGNGTRSVPATMDEVTGNGTRSVPATMDEVTGNGTRSVPATMDKIVLFVGNILLSKGAGVLVEACARMRDQFCRERTPWRSERNATEGVPERDGDEQPSPWPSPGGRGDAERNATEGVPGRDGNEQPSPWPSPGGRGDAEPSPWPSPGGRGDAEPSPWPSPEGRGDAEPSPWPSPGGRGFHCYLVGQGRDERKVRALIEKYDLGDCVTLAGACPQSRLVDWYRAADVVALPSFSEGVPNVLQEAMTCGRPFVATRVGGIPEIAHPSFSRLISPGDAGELAEALAAMLADPPTVDPELVAERTISWRRSAEMLAEVLEAAIAGRNCKLNGHRTTDCTDLHG